MNSNPAGLEIRKRVKATIRWACALFVLRKLLWTLVFVLVALPALVTTDWWLRLGEPGYRWLLSGCGWFVIVTGLAAWLVPVFRWRLTEIQAAWLIEKCEPQLRGHLASSLSLMSQPNLVKPSTLVHAAVEETRRLVDGLQPLRLLRWDQLWIGMVSVSLLGFAMGGAVWTSPHLARIGLTRLLSPADTSRWPTRYEMSFTALPEVVACGEPVTVVVASRSGKLPRKVTVQQRPLNGDLTQFYELRGGTAEIPLVLPAAAGDYELRAMGSDGDTGWQVVRVAERPKLLNFELTAEPPACLSLPPVIATGPLRAPEGARMNGIGISDQRLRSAVIETRMDDQELQVLEMQLSEDGRFFFMSEPWVLTGNGQYRIVITAESGLQASTEQHSVRVQVNVPPVLEWEFQELLWRGEYALLQGYPAKIELGLVDDYGWRRISLAAAKPVDDGPWTIVWESNRDSADERQAKADFSIHWNPEARMADGESWRLKTAAQDNCGLEALVLEQKFRVLKREEYRQALHAVWNSWRSQLAPFQNELLELETQSKQMLDTLQTGDASDLRPYRSSQGRVAGLVSSLIADDNVAYRDLVLLSQWIERYGFVEERIGVSILEMKQEWQANLIPQLSRAAELWDRIRTTNFETLDAPIDLVGELVKVHRLLTEFFVRWLGDTNDLTTTQVIEQVNTLYEAQLTLIQATERLRSASLIGDDPTDSQAAELSREQLEIAASLENLQPSFVQLQAAGLDDAFLVEPVTAWQRESARLLHRGQFSASLEMQSKAVGVLRRFLEAEFQGPGTIPLSKDEEWIAWYEKRLNQIEGLIDEMQILQHLHSQEVVSERQDELVGRLRRLQMDFHGLTKDAIQAGGGIAETHQSVLQEIQDAEKMASRRAFEQSEESMERGSSLLQEGIRSLRIPEESENLSRNENQFALMLKEWWVQQGTLVDDLVWLSKLTGGLDEREVKNLLSRRQGLIREAIMTSRTVWETSPLLKLELNEIADQMKSLESMYGENHSFSELLVETRLIYERLAVMATASPSAQTSEGADDAKPDSNDNPNREAEEAKRPAAWREQLAVIRRRQRVILEKTVELAQLEVTLPEFRIEVGRLLQEQDRLRLQTQELGKAALSLMRERAASTHESPEGQSKFPDPSGLPGLPGGSGNSQNSDAGRPSEFAPAMNPSKNDDGEDLGEQRHPLANIETRMSLVVEYFAAYDCSDPNQKIQEAILHELQPPESSGGDSSSSQDSAGQANQNDSGNVMAGQVRATDQSELLPAELMTRSGVWGHLPPQLQRSMQSEWIDGWIEGFEEASIEYFEQIGNQIEIENN